MQNGVTDAKDRWFAWGVRTNALQIPTGTGHYDGIIAGKATTIQGPTGRAARSMILPARVRFDVNFGAATFTGSLNPIGKNLSTLATRDFGIYSVTGGLMDKDAGLTADIRDGSSNYLGFFEGALYGPHAEEIRWYVRLQVRGVPELGSCLWRGGQPLRYGGRKAPVIELAGRLA